jgi:hypothetical protein
MSLQKILEQKVWDSATEDCQAVKLMKSLTFTPMHFNPTTHEWTRLDGKFKFLKLRTVQGDVEYGVFKCDRWIADFWHHRDDGYWFAVECPLIALEPDFDWSDDPDWNECKRLR